MNSSNYKRIVVTLLQAAITIGILWFLLRDPHKRQQMAEALGRAKGSWMLAGIAAYGVVEILAGLRWKLLLHVQKLDLGSIRLSVLILIGVFFNFFIPGGTGGDVVRVLYVMKEAPHRKSAAFLSVLFDRIIGLFALILLASIFITLRWSWLTSNAETLGYVWMTLAVLGISTVVVSFSFLASGMGWVHRLPPKFPGRAKLAEMAQAYHAYGRAWPSALLAVAGSMVSHLGYIFTFYCAARALEVPGLPVPTYADLCAIMPVVNTITALPISLGGVGVREGLFQLFLGELLNVDSAVAVVISSLGFMFSAAWGGLGGVLYLFYRPSRAARAHAAIRHEEPLVAEVVH